MSQPPTPHSPASEPADPELSYEQARAELAEVVQRLESGGVPLAESMKLWQRGEELAGICQRWLDGARATIDEARSAQHGPHDELPRTGDES
ncbi:exodeoxyribonuclease VII small subunit [Propionibacterium cyclohexanicum]|uniref:Exodeoxyribonuclease 7 small subunit n=1 Tax=Propionibacterium cyclohexanicum TaxID=64702 RepID=A0A1H9RFV2_9ACTN|nr:exodeoxyribonuclease VII small subunit [Propionibacterium cyclohexanicum]SER71636.1 exodeoxyribonuclease VII small subunit [Propionibacterium cyclohexanicum]